MNNISIYQKCGGISKITIMIITVYVFFLINGYGRISNYLSAVMLIPIALLCFRVIPPQNKKTNLYFFLFYTYFAITSLNNNDLYYLISNLLIYMLLIFSPLLLSNYISRYRGTGSYKKLFICFFIIWIIIAIISTTTYYQVEEGGREYASEHSGAFLGGGYSAVYLSSLLSVFFLRYILANKIKKDPALLILSAFGLSVALLHVMVTMSAITLVATISGVVLTILINVDISNNSGQLKRNIILLILATLILIVILNRDNLANILISLGGKVSNRIYAKRLTETGFLLKTGTMSYHVSLRLQKLEESCSTFFKYPLFGIGHLYGNSFELCKQNGVGSHSELLDTFAKYGIVGGLPLFMLFYNQIKSICRSSVMFSNIPFVVLLIILFSFNPFLSPQTSLGIFLMIPMYNQLTVGRET